MESLLHFTAFAIICSQRCICIVGQTQSGLQNGVKSQPAERLRQTQATANRALRHAIAIPGSVTPDMEALARTAAEDACTSLVHTELYAGFFIFAHSPFLCKSTLALCSGTAL